jgi:hypothetical protein
MVHSMGVDLKTSVIDVNSSGVKIFASFLE